MTGISDVVIVGEKKEGQIIMRFYFAFQIKLPPLLHTTEVAYGSRFMNKYNDIDALHYDAHNFNNHTEDGKELLRKSVRENGFGRSIVVDKDNNIIAGNGIVEAARSLNCKNIRIIDTTGDELVVVRRTDLDIDSEEGRRMALADNATSAANLSWNYDKLQEATERWNVKPEEWGVKIESEEYRTFVSKFDKEVEKTTDDCYTPQDVYECIKSYFEDEGVIPKGAKIIRPFYPGGDYEREKYPEDCVVFDNPPFSIFSDIVRFYVDRGIKFMLFCPTLTSLYVAKVATFIAAVLEVLYANGARVNTSFATNLYPDDVAILTLDNKLRDAVKACGSQRKEVKKLLKYKYPKEVVNIAVVERIARGRVPMVWRRSKLHRISELSVQKERGGGQLFGGAYLQSRKQAAEQAAADELAAERRAAAADELAAARRAAAAEDVIKIELSPDELKIVEKLSENDEQ